MWIKNLFGSKKIGSEIVFGQKKKLGQKNVGRRFLWVNIGQNFFWSKRIWVKKNLGRKFIIKLGCFADIS